MFQPIFVLLVLWTVVTGAVPLCTTPDYGVVVCEVGMLAAECQLAPVLAIDGETLVCGDNSLTGSEGGGTIGMVTSTCPLAGFCRNRFGECVQSRRGVSCTECSEMGFFQISDNQQTYVCICYSSKLDPRLYCQPNDFFDLNTVQNVSMSRVYTKVTCDSHQSHELGCFQKVDNESALHRYGEPDPPVPHSCCELFNLSDGNTNPSYLGPQPGTFAGAGISFQTCNVVGGEDPDYRTDLNSSDFLVFQPCNGHGNWNTTSMECECFPNWRRVALGYSEFYGKEVFSCLECSGHWWPSPNSLYDDPAPYCVQIASPNKITGIDEPCGGGGRFIDGACSCFQNSTLGYFQLGEIGGKYDEFGNEIFVESCIECMPGHDPPLCL